MARATPHLVDVEASSGLWLSLCIRSAGYGLTRGRRTVRAHPPGRSRRAGGRRHRDQPAPPPGEANRADPPHPPPCTTAVGRAERRALEECTAVSRPHPPRCSRRTRRSGSREPRRGLDRSPATIRQRAVGSRIGSRRPVGRGRGSARCTVRKGSGQDRCVGREEQGAINSTSLVPSRPSRAAADLVDRSRRHVPGVIGYARGEPAVPKVDVGGRTLRRAG